MIKKKYKETWLEDLCYITDKLTAIDWVLLGKTSPSDTDLMVWKGCILVTELSIDPVEQLYRTAILVDSRSTSMVSANIGTFVGCDPTIRCDCNLIN